MKLSPIRGKLVAPVLPVRRNVFVVFIKSCSFSIIFLSLHSIFECFERKTPESGFFIIVVSISYFVSNFVKL